MTTEIFDQFTKITSDYQACVLKQNIAAENKFNFYKDMALKTLAYCDKIELEALGSDKCSITINYNNGTVVEQIFDNHAHSMNQRHNLRIDWNNVIKTSYVCPERYTNFAKKSFNELTSTAAIYDPANPSASMPASMSASVNGYGMPGLVKAFGTAMMMHIGSPTAKEMHASADDSAKICYATLYPLLTIIHEEIIHEEIGNNVCAIQRNEALLDVYNYDLVSMPGDTRNSIVDAV